MSDQLACEFGVVIEDQLKGYEILEGDLTRIMKDSSFTFKRIVWLKNHRALFYGLYVKPSTLFKGFFQLLFRDNSNLHIHAIQ